MNNKNKMLPDFTEYMRKPLVYLAVAAVPQFILLIINSHSFSIISGNMNEVQQKLAIKLFTAELILFVLSSVIPVILSVFKKQISWKLNWALLALPVTYLWIFILQIDTAIPSSVKSWIMPVERILFYQLIFIMPVIFYSIIGLSSFKTKMNRMQDITLSAVMAAVPPILWFIGISGFFKILFGSTKIPSTITGVILPLFLVLCTVMMFFAITRLLLIVYEAIPKKKKTLRTIMYLFFGIIMPVCGLLLNREIKFPADFQCAAVYVFAVINGFFLLIPDTKIEILNIISSAGRCIFFPFTLYFFLVFLPFLPLSIMAIAAAGAGFLILTPVILFILHSTRLFSDFKVRFKRISYFKKNAILTCAIFVLPVFFTASAFIDKLSLHSAIEYIYEPDYTEDNSFYGSRMFVKQGLRNLEKKKSGIYLPFLTGYYNWVVFDNLVLSDRKMNYIYKAFFGEDLKIERRSRSPFSGLFSPRRRILTAEPGEIAESGNVIISSIDSTSNIDGEFIKLKLKIELKNLTENSLEEFRTKVLIPEGVFISGYWLNVGRDRVPGRIFEKKTAIWIYQMIRSEKRDPGLLYYTGQNRLNFHVFPFAGLEKRTTEIEFLYHRSLSGKIQIGRKFINLKNTVLKTNYVIASHRVKTLSVLLPARLKSELPVITRKPYFHFIVDWSAGSKHSNVQIIKRIKKLMLQFPKIKYCAVTIANYETRNVTDGIIPLYDLDKIDSSSFTLQARGGFCKDRAIKKVLLSYSKDQYLFFPIIFVVKDHSSRELTEGSFDYFKDLLPDVDKYYTSDGNIIRRSDFYSNIYKMSRIIPQPVLLLNISGNIIPCSVENKSEMIHFKLKDKVTSLYVYDSNMNKFLHGFPLKYIAPEEPYSEGQETNALCIEKIYNPSLSSFLFKPVVMKSKETGILNPATSYIVVENSAQWKMLELKEKQKLNNKETLNITKTPEPSIFILAGALILFHLIYMTGKRYYSKR